MTKQTIENLFSTERLHKYFQRFPNDESKAIELYKANIKLSESLYSVIAVTEVALRNRINFVLSNNYGTQDWFNSIKANKLLKELNIEIEAAIDKITKRQESVNPGKITAELTFGFWTSLFNTKYEKILWKTLRLAFPNLQKSNRQRKKVSAPINNIRNLRNRIFHFEPIIWNLNKIEKLIVECYNLLEWMNAELPDFVKEFDNTSNVIQEIRLLYKN